jgi:hypothetical protein
VSFLEQFPRSVRWAIFVPLGIIGAVIVEGVLEYVCDAMGLAPSTRGTGVTRGALVAFGWALALSLFPAVLSPRPWIVGIVMFVLGLLWRVVPLFFLQPYQRARLPELAVYISVTTGVHVVGGGVGLYLVRAWVKQHSKGSAA